MSVREFRWAIAALPLLVLAACGGGGSDTPVTPPPPPPVVSLVLTPATATVALGQTAQFTATVSGSTNRQVTWQVNGATGGSATDGTISTSGLYTAPSAMPGATTVTIKAIAAADATKFKTATVTLTTPPTNSYRTVGYMPDWSGSASAIQYDKLTHICYAFLMANADGSLKLDSASINLTKLQDLTTRAHAQGVKVLISLGGWGNSKNPDDSDGPLALAMRSETTRANLATNCQAFIEQYGLDGFDMDWEGFSKNSDGEAWGVFMQAMQSAMKAKGKLTTTALAQWFGSFIPNSALAYVDFVNVMAYDNPGAQHSSYDAAVSAMNYWKGRGLAWDKLVLGVPFYGYPTSGSRGDTAKTYAAICAGDANAHNLDVSGGYAYNGIPTIQQKASYVVTQQAGGIMIWEISQDATGAKSLLGAIHGVLSAQ